MKVTKTDFPNTANLSKTNGTRQHKRSLKSGPDAKRLCCRILLRNRLCSDTCLITRLRVSMIPTLRQRRKGNRGNHSICSARAFRSPLKVHALKRCTFWRETCLASVFALRLATQRARAANRSAKDVVRLVPSQLKLRNKSTRSVLPFKLCYSSFSWNRTIVSQKI